MWFNAFIRNNTKKPTSSTQSASTYPKLRPSTSSKSTGHAQTELIGQVEVGASVDPKQGPPKKKTKNKQRKQTPSAEVQTLAMLPAAVRPPTLMVTDFPQPTPAEANAHEGLGESEQERVVQEGAEIDDELMDEDENESPDCTNQMIPRRVLVGDVMKYPITPKQLL